MPAPGQFPALTGSTKVYDLVSYVYTRILFDIMRYALLIIVCIGA